MQVTDAKGWLALLGLGVLVATSVVWGFLGRVPTKLDASGILMHSGGLADVGAPRSGQILALEIDVGDFVRKGQEIAVLAQPELKEQISGAEARLNELRGNYER